MTHLSSRSDDEVLPAAATGVDWVTVFGGGAAAEPGQARPRSAMLPAMRSLDPSPVVTADAVRPAHPAPPVQPAPASHLTRPHRLRPARLLPRLTIPRSRPLVTSLRVRGPATMPPSRRSHRRRLTRPPDQQKGRPDAEALPPHPRPTPVPPEVLSALSEPVVHHRAPRFTEILKDVVAGMKYVYQTENDVLVFAASRHRRHGVRRGQPREPRATTCSWLASATSASAGSSSTRPGAPR